MIEAMTLEPGIYYDISNELYHSQKDAVSNSGLGDILRSPYHYYSKHLDPNRPAETSKAGQLEGTLAHCAILEPDEFDKRYVIGPDWNRNSNKWKEYAAECEAAGILPLKQEQYDVAMRQGESVRNHPGLSQAFACGRAEVSAFWQDEETGALCRCRPDWVAEYPRGVVLVDVKTYSDASPAEFSRQVGRKGYYRQDAMYSEGYSKAANVPVLGFLFVAVETEWPYACSVLMLDDDSKAAGNREYHDALAMYAECQRTNQWPGYSAGIETIRLPAWKLAA